MGISTSTPTPAVVPGYCYNASTKASVWSTTADTYALGGMACDNGIIVFGNDYDHLYVVK